LLNAPQNCFATTSDLTSSRAVLRRRTVSDTPGPVLYLLSLLLISASPRGGDRPTVIGLHRPQTTLLLNRIAFILDRHIL
jgi:hypothetical protein